MPAEASMEEEDKTNPVEAELQGVAMRVRALVHRLCDVSGPFNRLGLGSMQAGLLQNEGPTASNCLCHDRCCNNPLVLPGLPLVVEGPWIAWLRSRAAQCHGHDDHTDNPRCGAASDVSLSDVWRNEERLVEEVCVLAYTLECAMRRLVLHLVTTQEDAAHAALRKTETTRVKSSAPHSVLLRDISAAIVAESRRASWPTASALASLHHEFVDPNGLNLRNVVMHGYVHPLVPRTTPVEDATTRLLWGIRGCLRKHLCTVVASAVCATENAAHADVAPSSSSPSMKVPLPLVLLEREPRRREATCALVEVLAARCARVGESGVVSTPWETDCAAAMASMLAAFPRFEALLRLVAAVTSTSTAVPPEDKNGFDAADAAVHAFVPTAGQQFDDLDALMARCTASVGVAHLDALFSFVQSPLRRRCGGNPDTLPGSPGGDARSGSWSWWCAVLVADSGPRIRDLMFHGKWSPLTHTQTAGGWGNDSAAPQVSDDNERHETVTRATKCLAAMVVTAVHNAECDLLPTPPDDLPTGEVGSQLTLNDRVGGTAQARSWPFIGLDDGDVQGMGLEFHPLRLLQRRLQQWYDSVRENNDANAVPVRGGDTRDRGSLRLCKDGTAFCTAEEAHASEAACAGSRPTPGAAVVDAVSDAIVRCAQGGDVDAIAVVARTAVAKATRHMVAAVRRVLGGGAPSGAAARMCVGDIHAVVTSVETFWFTQAQRHQALMALVVARTAREGQRKNAAIAQRVRSPLIDLCFICIAGYIDVATSGSADAAVNGSLRRMCRETSAVLSPSNTQALHKVMHALLPHLWSLLETTH